MIRAALILALVGGVTVPSAQLPALDGTWTITSVSVNGRVYDGGGVAIIIAGTAYAQSVNGEVNERGTLKLDRSKTPVAIDFVITDGEARNSTQLGIVEVSGDSMKLHLNRAGATERPVDFNPLAEHFLIIASKG